ncbi:uncharacterized protein V1477_007264, partial [Vespula maculifrons]
KEKEEEEEEEEEAEEAEEEEEEEEEAEEAEEAEEEEEEGYIRVQAAQAAATAADITTTMHYFARGLIPTYISSQIAREKQTDAVDFVRRRGVRKLVLAWPGAAAAAAPAATAATAAIVVPAAMEAPVPGVSTWNGGAGGMARA